MKHTVHECERDSLLKKVSNFLLMCSIQVVEVASLTFSGFPKAHLRNILGNRVCILIYCSSNIGKVDAE